MISNAAEKDRAGGGRGATLQPTCEQKGRGGVSILRGGGSYKSYSYTRRSVASFAPKTLNWDPGGKNVIVGADGLGAPTACECINQA